MDHWPWDLLTPRKDRWRLQGVALGGGVNVAGSAPMTRTDGGGLWVGEQEIEVDGRLAIKAIRAIELILDAGVGRMVAWTLAEPFAPLGLSMSEVTHSDGAPFDDGSLYLDSPAGATVTADCALRATSLPISMISGVIEGGEDFSIYHTGPMGIRRYRVKRVVDDVIQISPPLREAIPEGGSLYFLRVGCVSRLMNPDTFLDALDAQRGQDWLVATAQWAEVF